MEIGAQLYSLRDFCKTPADLRQTLKKVAAIGYRTIQVSGICRIDYRELKDYCDEFGLRTVVTHIAPDLLLGQTQQVIEAHKTVGCTNIGIGSMPERYCHSLEGLDAFLTDFMPVIHKINDAGMKFTYHNHSTEFEKYDGRALFDMLFERTKACRMNFTLDTYWAQFGGRDVEELIYFLKGRMEVCHFKDMVIVRDEQRIAPVGSGNLNFKKLTKACRETGVKYIMVEQDFFYGADEFESMASSYEYLRELV